MNNIRLLNGNNLAYIGDAYYELYIRTYLINKGITKNVELQKEAIKDLSLKVLDTEEIKLMFNGEIKPIIIKNINKQCTLK